MIGRVRNSYNSLYSGYASGQPAPSASSLTNAIEDGFVALFGETAPVASQEAVLVEASDAEKRRGKAKELHIYEYIWTVAVTGKDPAWFNTLDGSHPLIVQMIFHEGRSRFTVQEVAANLKQIPPYKETLVDRIQDWAELVRPLVDTAGKVLQAGGLTAPGKIVSAISGMKINSVPVDKFPWYVKTFSAYGEPGIEWHIPATLLVMTGNRITGSLGVYFMDCGPTEPAEATLSLEIKAILKSSRRDDQRAELFINPTNTSATLEITPTNPPPAPASRRRSTAPPKPEP